MQYRFSRLLLSTAIIASLSLATGLAQQKKQKQVKDEGEREVFANAVNEKDLTKKLQFLDQWKQKYPESDFKVDRLQIYLTTYQALGKGLQMHETAKELVSVEPNNVQGLYWLTVLTEGSVPPTPDNLSTGEKAAQSLLKVEKPEQVQADAWTKMQSEFEVVAHKTLGYIFDQRKDFAAAEAEYRKVLEKQPNFAQISYQLGRAILNQQKADRYPEMLFHLARAASFTGTGELPPPQRKVVDAFFVKSYKTFHGSEDGVNELREKAKASPMPPAGLTIENVHEINARKEKEFASQNPALALWMNIKTQLTGTEGPQYFESSMKGAALPGGAGGAQKFKATVISTKPVARPKEIVIGIEKADVADATLVLETPMASKADPGTPIEFEGVATEYSKDPFMVKFAIDSKDKISGWPAPPPPAKKAPGVKKAAPKKQ